MKERGLERKKERELKKKRKLPNTIVKKKEWRATKCKKNRRKRHTRKS